MPESIKSISAESLLTRSLSSQIEALGGEGYNCSVTSTPIKGSYSVKHLFSTEDGDIELVTQNEYMVGLFEVEAKYYLYHCGDAGVFELRKFEGFSDDGSKVYSSVVLGSDYKKVIEGIKARWPNRVVLNFTIPPLV